MKTITVGTTSFNLSDEQVKALEWEIVDLKTWLTNALKIKINNVINSMITDNSVGTPSNMIYEEKLSAISVLGFSGWTGFTITITIDHNQVDVDDDIINLTEEQTKALFLVESELKTLIETLMTDKANECINKIIGESNPEALTMQQKLDKITAITLKSAKTRQDEFEAGV